MCSDAVYLNAMVFVYHTYINLAAGLELESLPPSSPANKYFPKTLRLLRERLADSSDNMKLSDSTVIVVLSLANHAHRLGQYEAARSHLGGLRKLVDLRGGISNFRRNPKLLLEMFRCDIGMALHNGLDTLFFNDPTREQYMPYLDKLSSFIPLECRPDVETCTRSNTLGLTCPELAKAWDMMQTFCSLINYAAESKRKIPQETMLNTMAAVMYRLLHMRFPSGSLDEVVRLGLSVFCSHIFLQWSNVGLPLHNLPLAYKTCLLDFGNSSKISTKILFWLLMVGRMAVFGADEDTWLKPWLWLSVNECGAGSWGEARTIVQHFQWIDFVHDQYGRVIYDAVCALHFSDGNTPHIVGIHSVKTTSPA
ncbi:hypothetical protein VM1G_02890 [Cytospora mali]|uniref:Uncharacterized protein n=1 Tax=Cytospora mali TaxID=578113 RepID=A0A194VTE4_CYTMA|nr:hypothetical protein VM1G_02890 [Valsa mali]